MTGGRVALVTGASRGIGRAVVLALARDGYDVVGVARDPGRFAGLPCRAQGCDVADRDAVARLATRVAADCGRLDALVNCAGIVRPGPFETATPADMAAQFGVNLWGVVNVTQACLPLLKAAGGAIVNVSSTLSQRPVPGGALYAATKGAVESLTRALAIELAEAGIRVNAVQPALVRSDIWTAAGMAPAAYEALLEARARDYPLGRVGEPEDVAELVAYLVSDRAAWMTGACLPIDGGSLAGQRRR
jgi:NAD(P)-dependent dehydrogenase (short-subunit alcohol dehydrogenase family)